MNQLPLRARLYDWEVRHVARRQDEDAPFYRQLATGPTLELACGTGRLTAKLVQTAPLVVGIDLDADMLAAAKQHTEGRAQLVHADMRRYSFAGRPFALVAVPYNSLQLLTTLEAQVACLANAAAVVQREGRLALEVSTFGAGGSVSRELLADAEGIELWGALDVEGELVHYRKQFDSDGATIHDETVTLRDYAAGEFESVIAAGGFVIEAARPFRRGQLVVAAPTR